MFTDLKICRQSHVNLLPIRSDSVQQQGVVQRAVPHSLEAVESPERVIQNFSGNFFQLLAKLIYTSVQDPCGIRSRD